MIATPEEFVHLRTSPNAEEYLRAANDSAPVQVWRQIVEQYPDMKKWVVQNKTVPAEILESLASDILPEVRAAVASKNKLPAHLFKVLGADKDPLVRARIAHNKNAPTTILELLSQDENAFVRETAQGRLNGRTGRDNAVSDTGAIYVLNLYDKRTELWIRDVEVNLQGSFLGELLGLDLNEDPGLEYPLTSSQIELLRRHLHNSVDFSSVDAFLGSRFGM